MDKHLTRKATTKPTGEAQDIEARVDDYLASGGLFNPEMMEHDKVRELLIDYRAAVVTAKLERDGYREQAEAVDDLIAAAVEEDRKSLNPILSQRNEQLTRDLAAIKASYNVLAEHNEKLTKELADERLKRSSETRGLQL